LPIINHGEDDNNIEDNDDVTNDEWTSTVQYQLKVYRLAEHDILKNLLIKKEQMRLSHLQVNKNRKKA
jgi:hypothetical protein